MKLYCHRCQDFTYHKTRPQRGLKLWCQRCLGRGNPYIVYLIMILPIAAFIYSVWRLYKGGGW